MSTAVPDLRGRMCRERRLMPPQETIEFLRRQKVANVGTVDASGRPYVVPLVYIYEGGDLLYLHTGDHQGHFLTNVQNNPQICVEVSEIGDLHRGKPYACNSALERRYQAELKQHEEALEPILQAARHGTVTLLYSSHDTEHNNAVVLREYLDGKLGSNRESKRGKSAA